MLVDELLPIFDVSDELAIVAQATPDSTWDALMNADLIDVGRGARWSVHSARFAHCPRSPRTYCTVRDRRQHRPASPSMTRPSCR